MIQSSNAPMPREVFRDAMSILSEPPPDSGPPQWDYWRHDLWQRAVSGQDPSGFAGWPCIYHTMRVDHWRDATDVEYPMLKSAGGRWLDACIMPDFGYPKDYYAERYSAALIHQAHHIYQWQKWSGIDVANLGSIFEFGGGYGAMALVLRRLGFQGEYTIIDLPEFSLLQQYFLSNVGVNGVTWLDVPMDMHGVPKQDLLIGCYSLSEVDYAYRYFVTRRADADNYLFLYSNKFVGYDNAEYFQEFIPMMMPDVHWHHLRADHLPEGNHYTFGKRRAQEELA